MAKRETLEERFINYVRNTLDISVANTGYPVTGHVLSSVGIANRKQLRELERRGHIKSVTVQATEGGYKGQVLKAYYTERELPKVFIEQQATEAPAK